MTSAAVKPPSDADIIPRGRVIAWGIWDWGSAAFNAVIVTFVFSPYLTKVVGKDLPGPISANTWLGWALGIAGLCIALLAPVIGQRADASGHRKRALGIWSAVITVIMVGLFWVKNDYHYLWLGLLLMGIGSIVFELAAVSYNAMLWQVSNPKNIGRVSAFGWSMGYFGGIVLLLICYVGFIAPDNGWFGASSDGGLKYRMVALFAAVWFGVFALPALFKVPEVPGTPAGKRVGFRKAYQLLFADIRDLYRTDRHTVYFLGASALFRDGLAAIFTFGAVLAVTVYGINESDVLIFGVAANVISALGALVAGRFDDRLGPKAVIMTSLIGMIASGTVLLFLSGPTAFWIFGLILCLFVGPAQSSSRTYLARLTPAGREGQMFGLYATTGRAVSFLAPALFGLFTFLFHADRAGIVGIVLVLIAGLVALWPVRPPATAP
jgi:UMF1 family MFS transporter